MVWGFSGITRRDNMNKDTETKGQFIIRYSLKFTKLFFIAGLLAGAYIQYEQTQSEKFQGLFKTIQQCPAGATLVIETTTPIFGKGVMVRCILKKGGQFTSKAPAPAAPRISKI